MTCKNFSPLWGSWTVGGRKSRKRRRKSRFTRNQRRRGGTKDLINLTKDSPEVIDVLSSTSSESRSRHSPRQPGDTDVESDPNDRLTPAEQTKLKKFTDTMAEEGKKLLLAEQEKQEIEKAALKATEAVKAAELIEQAKREEAEKKELEAKKAAEAEKEKSEQARKKELEAKKAADAAKAKLDEEEAQREAKKAADVAARAKLDEEEARKKERESRAAEERAQQDLKKAEQKATTLEKEESRLQNKVVKAETKLDAMMKRFYEIKRMSPAMFKQYETQEIHKRRMVNLPTERRFTLAIKLGRPPIPQSTILTVAYHGKTNEPFILPLRVVRRMSTDIGLSNFSEGGTVTELLSLMKNLNIKGPDLIKNLDAYIDNNKERSESARFEGDHAASKRYEEFKKAKHYKTTKNF